MKLDRFVAGAGDVYTTLKERPRTVTLDGQRQDPDDPDARLYPTCFCRDCGRGFHRVALSGRSGGQVALPRAMG